MRRCSCVGSMRLDTPQTCGSDSCDWCAGALSTGCVRFLVNACLCLTGTRLRAGLQLLQVLVDVACAMTYLHTGDIQIVHRDLKSQNGPPRPPSPNPYTRMDYQLRCFAHACVAPFFILGLFHTCSGLSCVP